MKNEFQSFWKPFANNQQKLKSEFTLLMIWPLTYSTMPNCICVYFLLVFFTLSVKNKYCTNILVPYRFKSEIPVHFGKPSKNRQKTHETVRGPLRCSFEIPLKQFRKKGIRSSIAVFAVPLTLLNGSNKRYSTLHIASWSLRNRGLMHFGNFLEMSVKSFGRLPENAGVHSVSGHRNDDRWRNAPEVIADIARSF